MRVEIPGSTPDHHEIAAVAAQAALTISKAETGRSPDNAGETARVAELAGKYLIAFFAQEDLLSADFTAERARAGIERFTQEMGLEASVKAQEERFGRREVAIMTGRG